MLHRVAVVTCLAIAAISGCSSTRTLPAVKEMGDRQFRRENWEAARVEYQEYVDRKPGDKEVQILLAQCLIKLGQPDLAVTHAQVAFDLEPNDAEALETYCLALAEAKKTDELYRVLNGNCQTRGSVADYDRLARFQMKLGDPDGAERSFIMAAKVDGGKTIEPQLALANFYKSIGDKAGEKRRLRMALYLKPTDQKIYDRLRELGEIPGPSLALFPEEAGSN
ncbi:MAG: tetratricopeptide repeat protein [Phycisphaeraceae bacterium]|nr:tetratricopeptide repeat protein [Phycisphaeraceae bacterium]